MACRDSSTLLLVECPSGVVLLFRCRPFVDWLFPNYKGILGWKYLVGSVRSVIWSYKRDVAEAVEGDTGVVDVGFVVRRIWELLQVVREIAEVGC
jgi:hypothetical protein